jgi:hypothetical protein
MGEHTVRPEPGETLMDTRTCLEPLSATPAQELFALFDRASREPDLERAVEHHDRVITSIHSATEMATDAIATAAQLIEKLNERDATDPSETSRLFNTMTTLLGRLPFDTGRASFIRNVVGDCWALCEAGEHLAARKQIRSVIRVLRTLQFRS